MSNPFIGEIKMFGGNFAPRGYAFCNGQLLAISQNTALFSLIGTIYGGDGRTTFALPDLRGRSPVHYGQGPGLSSISIGQRFGAETHTLNVIEMPNHTHSGTVDGASMPATTEDGGETTPSPSFILGKSTVEQYSDESPNTSLPVSGGTVVIGNTGGNQPFNIRNPYLAISYIIALVGIFPSRN